MSVIVLAGTGSLVPGLDSQEQSPTPIAPGTVVTDRSGYEMVYVPAATFQMGITVDAFSALYRNQFKVDPQDSIKSSGETGIFDTYTATIGSFWIDRYEITIAQYTKVMHDCMLDGSCRPIDLSYAPHLINDPHKPQVGVPCYDALAFCSVRDARLPSEEEWEYAAGGSQKFAFPWGNTYEPNNVTFGDTYPVGTKPGNVSWIGVYDMAGSTAEWVDDRFKPYSPTSSWWPKNVDDEVERVLRGGGWEATEFQITTYAREGGRPDTSDSHIGFRCARTNAPK